jgi:UDP-glucose 4-epimerase
MDQTDMRKLALVTGGAGFIGSHVVRELARQSWYVRVLDNFSSGHRSNLAGIDDVDVIDGDVRDSDTCHAACRGAGCVFHLAAIPSVVASIENPIRSLDVDVLGTLQMLKAARDEKVRRFVFSSSAAIYGNSDVLPSVEHFQPQPQSPYAIGKITCEYYCENFFRLFGLETVVLRYFNVFGPRQDVNSGYAAVIPKFIGAALNGHRPVVYGDGLQTRDFVFVEDVARANVLAATIDGAGGNVFNVASGIETSLLDLLAHIEAVTGRALDPLFQPGRPGEVRFSRADVSSAAAHLGFTAKTPVRDALALTIHQGPAEEPSGVA